MNEALIQVQNLLALSTNWNGYDALAPDTDAIKHAENWVTRLYLEVALHTKQQRLGYSGTYSISSDGSTSSVRASLFSVVVVTSW
jgi:hypothetical protein